MTAPRIMIVEDEVIISRDLEQTLQAKGYEVIATPSTAEEAIELVESISPDLILMDIVLKNNMDGLEAALHIGERFQTPVIFLTAYADKAKLERAKLDNTFGYILKPVNESELMCCIEVALYKHDQENKLKGQLKNCEQFSRTLLKREDRIRELREENKGLKHKIDTMADVAATQ